jgi:hypothetical protein
VPVVISVLDVRDTIVPPWTGQPEETPLRTAGGVAGTTPARRRTPATAVVLAVGGVVQGLAIVAAALTVLAHLLGSAHRPSGVLVGTALVVLACWVVLAAAAGACVLDGTGHRLLTAVCYAELGMLAAVVVAGSVTPVFDRLGSPLPVSALALLAVAVPAGKLLLVGAPSTTAWLAQGPRIREQRPDPVAAHRLLCTLTLGIIALALTATAVLVPSPADAGQPATVSSSAH